eukprot:3019760-Alexandrium_andersonii.AAC.1
MRPPSALRARVRLGRGEAQVHGDSPGADVVEGDVRSLDFPEEPPTPPGRPGPTARSRQAAHLRGRMGRRRSARVARAPSEPPGM